MDKNDDYKKGKPPPIRDQHEKHQPKRLVYSGGGLVYSGGKLVYLGSQRRTRWLLLR